MRGPVSMRTARLAAGLLAACAAAACGHRAGPSAPAETLNIYSWSEYIAPDTVANFERETGIKVRYDTYESNEVLETKLLTGHTSYDIVLPTDIFFERLLRAGVFRKLDKTALPNSVNLEPDIMQKLAVHDPGNQHAVPYLWSTMGIGYNVDMIRTRLGPAQFDSWSLVLDPKNAAKLQDCGITVIDSPLDILSSVLIYLGKDPNSRDPAEVTAAADVLMKIRPFVRSIDSLGQIGELANGTMCVSMGWSGDVIEARYRAREAGKSVQIRYLLPREGSLIIMDMMGIPADAPHPRNAELWMNYLMLPKVMADITNSVKYPNGNRASLPLVKDEIKSDPAIYPDAAARAKLHALVAAPPEHSRLVTRLWTRFRTGQ